MAAELEKIREQGYATSKAERVQDACTISGPVFGHQGRFVGALGIAGPATRLEGKQFEIRLQLVLEASRMFSNRLVAPARPAEEKAFMGF